MNLITLMRKIAPYVRPYKWLVVATLLLTLIGSLIAQVNAIVLDRMEQGSPHPDHHQHHPLGQGSAGSHHPLCPELLWRTDAHLRQQRPLAGRC